MVKYLIEETDCLIDHETFEGETALLKSLQFCSNDEISLSLIKAGADVNIASNVMLTPLHVAVQRNNGSVAKLLIERGAYLNVKEELSDMTSLHFAIQRNNYGMVSMLLYYGADTTITNGYGMTPFMFAVAAHSNTEIVEQLLEYEVDLNMVEGGGYSTLLLVMNYRNSIALKLIERGADLYYRCGTIHNAANLALAYEENTVFEKLWSMIKPDFLNEIEIDINNMLDANIKDNEEWCKRMHIIFNSDKAEMIVQKHKYILSHLITKCHRHRLKEDDVLPLVSVCLMYGAEVRYKHVYDTYRFFGYNEMLKLLLHMGITVNCCDDDLVLPYFICSVAPYSSKRYSYCRMCILIEKKEMEIKHISKYITYLYTLCEKCREYVGNGVPSLKELARLATRRAIVSKFEPKDTMMFYTIVNHLNVPKIIKKLIGYEIPLV